MNQPKVNMRTINAYTLNELSEDIQDKVIDKLRDINIDHEWYEHIIDEWKAKLADIGFKDAEISFSGFYSQGDGCSFSATLDLDLFLINDFEPLANEDLECRFEHCLGWSSYRRWRFTQGSFLSNNEMDALSEKFVDHINEYVNDLAGEIYTALEQEYEGLTSNETVKESLLINDYYFLKDGTLV